MKGERKKMNKNRLQIKRGKMMKKKRKRRRKRKMLHVRKRGNFLNFKVIIWKYLILT